MRLPSNDRTACDEGKTRVYSVEAGTWSLVEHRCETDESDKVWAVTQVERLGQFALVIDDAPVAATPIPVAAAVAPTPTAIPASAPAVIVQRISLPAQPPTPTPTQIPTTYALAQRETGIGADNRSGSNPDCSSGSDRVIGSNSTSLVRGWRFRIIRQHSLGRNWCAPDNRTFHRGIPCLQGKAANGQSKSIVEAVRVDHISGFSRQR